jgi:hypothetical protein
MKKALRLRPFGSFLILASLLIGALTVIRHYASAHNSINSVVVSSSGQRLSTLFDGLSPDPRYSVKDILAIRRALPQCGEKPGTVQGGEKSSSVPQSLLINTRDFLQRFFGNSEVYAANCLITFCGGYGWVQIINSCDTGGPCSGTYWDVTNNGHSDNGFFQDSGHCGSKPQCGCENLTC